MSSRIAYLISQFPETHETFILRELVALDEIGVAPLIISCKRCRDSVVHPRAAPFLSRTLYAADLVREIGPGALVQMLRQTSRLKDICATLARWARKRRGGWLQHVGAAVLGVIVGQMCRRRGIRHLHCHWATFPAGVGYFASLAGDVSFSISAHAWDIYAGDGLLAEKVERAAFVTTCTDCNARHLRHLATRPSKVILNYHGLLDFPARDAGVAREPVILAVGRLVETKGFEYLVRAFGQVAAHRADLRLRIVGSGPLKEALRRTAVDFAVADRVEFTGTVSASGVLREMSRASLLAVPSVIASDGDRDGIPNVILEAGAVGLPVVASDLSGIPEAIRHERTGLLVPPGDVAALAEGIERLLAGGEPVRRLAEGLYGLVRRCFDARANAVELARLFSGVKA